VTQTAAPVAGWYQDPYDARSLRWWDGTRWTEHAQPAPAPAPAPHQAAQQAPPPYFPPQTVPPQAPQQVPQHPGTPLPGQFPPGQFPPGPHSGQHPAGQQPPGQQHPGAPMPAGPGFGPEALLSAGLLMVEQNFQWVDITTSYTVLDRNGTAVGSVAETGQNAARKALRFMSQMDKFLSRTFEIRDSAGMPFLVLSRGAKLVKARIAVTRPDGSPVGEIVQDTVVGHISFDLVAGGHPVGKLVAENWFAFTFKLLDHAGVQVGRITRDTVGLAISVIGGGDYYYAEVPHPLPEPLRTLALGAMLTANTLLNPDSNGNQ